MSLWLLAQALLVFDGEITLIGTILISFRFDFFWNLLFLNIEREDEGEGETKVAFILFFFILSPFLVKILEYIDYIKSKKM